MTPRVRKASEFSLKKRIILWVAVAFGPTVIRLIGFWCRYRVVGYHHFAEAAKGGGVILALWHGRMLIPVFHLRNRIIVSLVSRSWDGEIIARIVEKLGYIARRGSPRDGGMEGFKDMLRDIKDKKVVSIFPDGPTGPRHFVQDGVLHLARMTGVPIVPFSYAAKSTWRIKSWDRYMIPKPFSKGVIIFHPSFNIPRTIPSESIESYRTLIQDKLLAVQQECDRLMNISPEDV